MIIGKGVNSPSCAYITVEIFLFINKLPLNSCEKNSHNFSPCNKVIYMKSTYSIFNKYNVWCIKVTTYHPH